MGRRALVVTLVVLAAAGAAATAGVQLPRPTDRDTCPVCGMLVSKYPTWLAGARYRDGHVDFFDGAKDLFKYLQSLSRYAHGRRRDELVAVVVTEFYSLERIDAHQAFFVIGSDVLGPMGHELVPLATRDDAQAFVDDHRGRRILRFDEVTAEVVAALDDGRL